MELFAQHYYLRLVSASDPQVHCSLQQGYIRFFFAMIKSGAGSVCACTYLIKLCKILALIIRSRIS
jgi:hypothetical protein